jgi:hypothetical protein
VPAAYGLVGHGPSSMVESGLRPKWASPLTNREAKSVVFASLKKGREEYSNGR